MSNSSCVIGFKAFSLPHTVLFGGRQRSRSRFTHFVYCTFVCACIYYVILGCLFKMYSESESDVTYGQEW